MNRFLTFLLFYGGAIAFYGAFNRFTFLHIGALTFWLVLFFIPKTKTKAISLLPAMVTIFVYDFLRVLAPTSISRLVTRHVIALERWLFEGAFGRMPTESFVDLYNPVLDFISGPVYGNHVTPFAIVGIYLLVRSKDSLRVDQFFWGFLLLNAIANANQLAFPVAPPWYTDVYGLAAPTELPGSNAAGLLRFDALIGFPYFGNLYGAASYPFGAMPSLHVAFPTWAALFCRNVWSRTAAISFVALTAFFAVYTNHHYIVDLIAGIALPIFVWWLVRTSAVVRFLEWFRATLNQVRWPSSLTATPS